MPRTASIGNGHLLILLDEGGLVKDLYYPYAGLEEHTLGLKHYIAVGINNKIYWLHKYLSKIEQSKKSLKAVATYNIYEEEVVIKIESLVYNEKNIFLRKVAITNSSSQDKKIKFFFHQSFRISENKFRNTGYYDPDTNSVIHYRGRRAFLVGLYLNEEGLDDYTVGLYNYREYKGSYKNIDSYTLSKNSVEHGPVDSVIAKEFNLPSNKSETLFYYLTASKNIYYVKKLQNLLFEKTPQHIFETTNSFWYVWARQRNFPFLGLSKKVESLFYKSLFVVRSHIDSKTGGIIASGDSSTYEFDKDSYAYVWPRDAVYIAHSLDKLGYFTLSRKLYDFLISVLDTKGYLLHKYQQDKSLGSSWHSWVRNNKKVLPLQLDESALLIWSLWNHYQRTKDVEYIEKNFNLAIKKIADFLVDYADTSLSLPESGYDIWEEDYAMYAYSISSVIGGLDSASNLAYLLKKTSLGKKYKERADLYKASLKKYFYNSKEGFFYKKIQKDEAGNLVYDSIPDMSTFFGLWYFNVFDLENPLILKEYYRMITELEKEPNFYIRYKGDSFLSSQNKENLWIITSLWMIIYQIRKASNKKDLKKVSQALDAIASLSSFSGIFPEQVSLKEHKPLNVAPLIWSHSCFLEAVAEYIEKLEKFGLIKICLPR